MDDEKIGHYQLRQSLGKGGMGEVFLAFDEQCGREVALKKIRADLVQYKTMQERFLKEAKIASQLTHPSIIAIYEIIRQKDQIYYTMPYVEGETLKQILRATREQQKKGEPLHPIGSSIPALIRIFYSVCQACAYAHSKEILHRDLKPDNIIVGKYGEVLILDWGLAQRLNDPQEAHLNLPLPINPHLTRPGKIVGTLTHLPPERALGEKATVLTDIYSLGVMLYQILTLSLPFKRVTLSRFKKEMHKERLRDPVEVAPHREIPRKLSEIVKKCLSPKKERYRKVTDIIADLENYIEGKAEWIPMKSLETHKKSDWNFQENVLLAKHMAIARSLEEMEWVCLMISKATFTGNAKIATRVKVGNLTSSIGFLLPISEDVAKKGLEEGYCLWIGKGCKLLLSNVEVVDLPDIELKENSWVDIRIEKIDNQFFFFMNDKLIINYQSHSPFSGTHFGLLLRGGDIEMERIELFMGSQNALVSCLSLPDAFLSQKQFSKATIEYQRIAHCFDGRAEGREALFRAGLSLLEEAKAKKEPHLFEMAQKEFAKLRGTAGAPLEYLGKSLIYQEEKESEEEVKCLELALRRYPKHPLLPVVVDHIIFRLHEAASHDRKAAYAFALLCLRHLPHIFSQPVHQKLLQTLKNSTEELSFLHLPPQEGLMQHYLAVKLAFCLSNKRVLLEMQTDASEWLQENLRLALLHLDQNPLSEEIAKIENMLKERSWQDAEKLLAQYPHGELSKESSPLYPLFGTFLWATQGQNAALSHFSAVCPSSYPPSKSLLAHYLLGNIDLKKGWIDQAFFFEKRELLGQLILFYTAIEEPEQAATMQNYFSSLNLSE